MVAMPHEKLFDQGVRMGIVGIIAIKGSSLWLALSIQNQVVLRTL